MGPETSIRPCLTASGRQIRHILSCDQTCPPADLSPRDNSKHGPVTGTCLDPDTVLFEQASNSDSTILSSSRLKTNFATHSVDPECGLDIPGCIITLRTELL